MKILDSISEFFNADLSPQKSVQPDANYGGSWREINSFGIGFDGEKNFGEIGPIKRYIPEYEKLRLRSWQAYFDSEIAKTVIDRYVRWVIGSGLKLQSEPDELILKQNGISIDRDSFTDLVEARFNLFSKSKRASYNQLQSFNRLQKSAKLNALIGGDVLVINRYDPKTGVNVQLIDGADVCSPLGTDGFPELKKNGNVVRHGVEIDKKGRHVAYHVRTDIFGKYERIPAYGKNTGQRTAFLYYGSEYRLENTRGVPLLSTVLESLAKLERYREATIGSAEERQKIAYTFEHGSNSTGENPALRQLMEANNVGAVNDKVPVDDQIKKISDKFAVTMNKTAYNLPKDVTMKALESKNELYFKDFYSVNVDIVCACVGIPPEVAMSKFDSNFSASRAALKDWEHTLLVERASDKEQLLEPVFSYWFDAEVLANKIQAPQFLQAKMTSNYEVTDAYKSCRFIGNGVPHIDPEKEVRAERAKLGIDADHVPLTTPEKSTEKLNEGEYKHNVENHKKQVRLYGEKKPSV